VTDMFQFFKNYKENKNTLYVCFEHTNEFFVVYFDALQDKR